MGKPARYLTTNNVIPLFQQPILRVCGGIRTEYKVTSEPPGAKIYQFPISADKVNPDSD